MTKVQEPRVDTQKTKQSDNPQEDRRRQFEEHMRRWRDSGLTQAEYCRRYELKWSTFHYWRKRLQEKATALTLVQVPVRKNLSCHRSHELALIVADRYTVEIGQDFNASTLARLVDTLERL
jgi:transposase-like protein